ncbi:MAG TPA: M14 family zinc carboxypeptidase, partial [Candidatus Hydrogenedentes bacterium]|nr:M14 family zinc carboxypeptidase [Candidatus Hydrogenedentota bacterium]
MHSDALGPIMLRRVRRIAFGLALNAILLVFGVTPIGPGADVAWAVSSGITISIDAEYPGGNVVVDRIDGDTVYLKPDLRDTEGWWFYWNFRVRGAAGRTITFRFIDRDPIGVRGPAVSTDGGVSWSWMGTKTVGSGQFTYAFPLDAREVRFAFTIPYQESDFRNFLARHRNSPNLIVESLCKSAKGRDVALVRAGRLDGDPRFRVLVTARHHACEAMASYVLEGMLEAVLADNDDGYWFLRNVEMMAVPFMDKDGVEDGDQGKNRRPYDHNRDYIGPSIHPETAALRTLARNWSNGKLLIALDLHCPYLRGIHNEDIYIVGSRSEVMWEQQQALGVLLEKSNRSGALPYLAAHNLPHGKSWNQPRNYAAGRSFGRWAEGIEGLRLAASFEIPYANAGGRAVTPDSARAFGLSLAKAVRRYLESADDPAPPSAPPLQVAGVFPAMTVMARGLGSDSEAGIGALIPWGDRLWAVGYVAHIRGQGLGLYEIREDMTMRRHPASITGTYANRMPHWPSGQAFIGPYAIDADG